MSDELKPCPFCGSSVVEPVNCKEDGPIWKIHCPLLCVSMVRASKNMAISDWNRRAPNAELAQAKADAPRLDWIDRQRSDFNHGVVLGLYFVKASSGQQFHGATFRAAIDAALQSQEVKS